MNLLAFIVFGGYSKRSPISGSATPPILEEETPWKIDREMA
jgi:hypothetical protein